MPPLQSLLLIDPETQTLEVLTFAFAREGCEVVAAQTAKQAAEVARRAAPQVVVIHAGAAAAGAAACCADLRRDEATREIPILVVADGRARKPTLDAGATAHLATPAYLRDIVTLARLLAGAGGAIGAQPGTEGRSNYDASLSEYGLYFLMRALAAVGIAAVLSLNRQGRRGEIHVAGGQVTVARTGGVSGLPALHTLLLWTEAALIVRFYGAQQARQIPLRSEETLADAERFLRDFRAAAAPLGQPDSVLVQDISVVAQRIGHIPSQVAPVLRLFDGCRTVTDMAADSPFTAFDSLRIAQRLQELGAIKRLQITAHPSEVVRGEIIGRGSNEKVPTPGSCLEPGDVVVEAASLAERLEAVLASQEPIPLTAPKRKEPAPKPAAAQLDPFAGVAAFPGAGAPVTDPFAGDPTERTAAPAMLAAALPASLPSAAPAGPTDRTSIPPMLATPAPAVSGPAPAARNPVTHEPKAAARQPAAHQARAAAHQPAAHQAKATAHQHKAAAPTSAAQQAAAQQAAAQAAAAQQAAAQATAAQQAA
ncbi:MAG: hypothetical protein HY906_10680, partial [Deltaproteobacteria bacterium]|nr:hypothetical protein [Deltaproteobacteria bacterium]